MPRSSRSFGFPREVVIALPANGEWLFRLVNRENERERYRSRVARHRPKYPDGPAVLWAGISMFEEQEQALSRATKKPIVVSRVCLEKGLGFYVAKTLGDGHHTVWGDPERLRSCSEIVYQEK